MDPINNRISPLPAEGISGPASPGPGSSPARTERPGFAMPAAQAGATSGPRGAASTPTLERLSQVAAEARAEGLDRAGVQDRLISAMAKETFGAQADEGMIASLSDTFRNDPHFSSIISRLTSALKPDRPSERSH